MAIQSGSELRNIAQLIEWINNEHMNERDYGRVGNGIEWVREWVFDHENEWVCEWVSEWVSERMCGFKEEGYYWYAGIGNSRNNIP